MFEDNMSRYADIINLPRPKSSHKPMSMHDRAAQFSPFSALTGLDDELAETAILSEAIEPGGLPQFAHRRREGTEPFACQSRLRNEKQSGAEHEGSCGHFER